MVDCAGGEYQNQGCNGGLMHWAYDYIIDHHINSGDKYGYTGRNGKCRTSELGEGEYTMSSCVAVDPTVEKLVESLRK